MAVGWVVPVGKGGDRRAEDTDGNIYPADSGAHTAACLDHTKQNALHSEAEGVLHRALLPDGELAT